MTRVESRCCFCRTVNENEEYEDDLQYGAGRQHGTEHVYCEGCEEVTLQNRCGASVPTGDSKDTF